MFETIAFYFFAALSLTMFLIVVTTRNILYALTALISGMIFLSAFFFLLGAEFLGVVQIAIYAGAIVVLYAFGMMFFDTSKEVIDSNLHKKNFFLLSVGTALILVLILGAPIVSKNLVQIQIDSSLAIADKLSNIELVGYVLFTKYLIPFEVTAIMLLTAMIGGIATGLKKTHFPDNDQNSSQSQSKEIL